MTRHSAQKLLPILALVILAFGSMLPCVSAQTPSPRHVLAVYWGSEDFPSSPVVDAGIRQVLSRSDVPIDYYAEYLESDRFPEEEASVALSEYIRRKYHDRPIDLVLAVSDVALEFVLRYRAALFPDAPIVYLGYGTPNETIRHAGAGLTGVISGVGFVETLELGLKLHPSTERVFLVAEAPNYPLRDMVRTQLEAVVRGVQITSITEGSVPRLVAAVNAVPARSLILFVRYSQDEPGSVVGSPEVARLVAHAAAAPVYGVSSTYIGSGVVGGVVGVTETHGTRLGEMARQILHGTRAQDIPLEQAQLAPMFDWRQLRRWGISEARLPAGSVTLFRELGTWERYRWYIVAIIAVTAIQTGLITGLLVHRARRRRAEAQTRNSEARYRSVVDTQSELICRFRPDSTLTFVNDAYCRFWNKTRGELIGRKFTELIPPSARAAVLERVGGLLSGTDSHEHAVTLADGTIGWQHWINHAILDERGRLIEMQGVGRDITDRKRAEEAIVQLEARNSAMLRAIPDLMFVLQRDGTYVDYHARDPKFLFAPPEQFLGRSVREIMPSELAQTLMNALEQACSSEEVVVVEYELPMNGPRYFEARLVSTGNDRVLSMVRDITEAKRAHKRNRDLAGRLITSQEAERTRIARDLHDDVCQEIAALGVDISQLRQNAALQNADVQDTLLSAQRRTASVAESLRLLSHGLHPSVLQHIGLVAALQAHCAEVERQHHLQVNFFADGDVEPASQLVSLSLFRIAQEALRNTARHGHAQHATVALARRDTHLTLAVSDDGGGFDVVAARHNGGLGLVSIEERARLVKGRVTIHSCPGDGTTLNVRVPIEVVDHADRRRDERATSNYLAR
jgi:PAS domain S-box-containing protein